MQTADHPKIMSQITVRIEREAGDYLKALIPQRIGAGAFISRLILEHKLRKELAYRPAITGDDWTRTGINVD